MKKLTLTLTVLLGLAVFTSCSKDKSLPEPITVEQQVTHVEDSISTKTFHVEITVPNALPSDNSFNPSVDLSTTGDVQLWSTGETHTANGPFSLSLEGVRNFTVTLDEGEDMKITLTSLNDQYSQGYTVKVYDARLMDTGLIIENWNTADYISLDNVGLDPVLYPVSSQNEIKIVNNYTSNYLTPGAEDIK